MTFWGPMEMEGWERAASSEMTVAAFLASPSFALSGSRMITVLALAGRWVGRQAGRAAEEVG